MLPEALGIGGYPIGVRCETRRIGDGRQCCRPKGHPGECASSYAATTVDWGHGPDPAAPNPTGGES